MYRGVISYLNGELDIQQEVPFLKEDNLIGLNEQEQELVSLIKSPCSIIKGPGKIYRIKVSLYSTSELLAKNLIIDYMEKSENINTVCDCPSDFVEDILDKTLAIDVEKIKFEEENFRLFSRFEEAVEYVKDNANNIKEIFIYSPNSLYSTKSVGYYTIKELPWLGSFVLPYKLNNYLSDLKNVNLDLAIDINSLYQGKVECNLDKLRLVIFYYSPFKNLEVDVWLYRQLVLDTLYTAVKRNIELEASKYIED